jgi:hypothetical protein
MSPDFVRSSVNRRPFRPFIMHLAGGRSLPVRSPEFIIMPAEGRLVVVQSASGSAHVVDLLLVTDLEFPNAQITD